MTEKAALLRIVVIMIVNSALRGPEGNLVVPCQREVTVLRLREHRFCLVVMNALEACTVGYRNFTCMLSVFRIDFSTLMGAALNRYHV